MARLVLLFTDDGTDPEVFGFSTWRTYSQEELDVAPDQLPRTDRGVGVGTPFSEAAGSYPEATGLFDELVGGQSLFVDDQIWLAAADDSDTITFAEAGFLCGE